MSSLAGAPRCVYLVFFQIQSRSSGVLPVNDDNLVGNWTNTTMNLTKTPKRIRNSTEDEEVNIESETSEGSDFVQRRRRLNKKARRAKAKAKLFPKTPIEKPKKQKNQ